MTDVASARVSDGKAQWINERRCRSRELLSSIGDIRVQGFDVLLGMNKAVDQKGVLFYFFYSPDRKQVCTLEVTIDDHHIIPSISNYWKIAGYLERELWEFHGLVFRNAIKRPLRYVDKEHLWQAKTRLGCALPFEYSVVLDKRQAQIDQWDFSFSRESLSDLSFDLALRVKNDCVVDSFFYLGHQYANRKCALHNKNAEQAIYLSSYLTPFNCWHSQVLQACLWEKALMIEVPEKGQLVRMLMMEIERVSAHLSTIYNLLAGICFDDLKIVDSLYRSSYRLQRAFSTNHRKVICLSGSSQDITKTWHLEALTFCSMLLKQAKSLYDRVVSSAKCHKKLKSGQLSGLDAISYGLTGPALRASGVNLDFRKQSGLYFYPMLDFEVPIGLYGTSYDRLLVLILELLESSKIISQLLDNIPQGPLRLDNLTSSSKGEKAFSLVEGVNGVLCHFLQISDKNVVNNFNYWSSDLAATACYQKSIEGLRKQTAMDVFKSFQIDATALIG